MLPLEPSPSSVRNEMMPSASPIGPITSPTLESVSPIDFHGDVEAVPPATQQDNTRRVFALKANWGVDQCMRSKESGNVSD